MSLQVKTAFVRPAEATLPALGVHVLCLVDSYMIWVGVTTETAETVQDAPRSGSLCADWACAMSPTSATTLYRTTSSDVACSIAQRLARRVGKPVFLSVDVPASLQHTRLLLDAERAVVDVVLSSS